MKKLICSVLSLALLFSVASSGYCIPATASSDKSSMVTFLEDLGSQSGNIVKSAFAIATSITIVRAVLGYALGPVHYVIASLGILVFAGGDATVDTIKKIRGIMA